METKELKELIQRYRALGESLTGKNEELEVARKQLEALDTEHSSAAHQWELEKENIRNTINAILTQVTAKRDELQRVERESAELRAKVDDRRRRNEEYVAILNRRRDAVLARKAQLDSEDRQRQESLDAFVRSRDESRAALKAALKKNEDLAAQEAADHEQKVRQLRSRIAETRATIEAEAKSWALEQAMSEWNAKSDARGYYLEEASAAEAGKDVWADLLQEANALQAEASFRALQDIRALLSA